MPKYYPETNIEKNFEERVEQYLKLCGGKQKGSQSLYSELSLCNMCTCCI